MSSAQSSRPGGSVEVSQAILHSGNNGNGTRVENTSSSAAAAPAPEQSAPKSSGYGLPCSKCRTYYRAEIGECPVCKSTERVSPTAIATPAPTVPVQSIPDPVVLDEERERFLREFKSQAYAAPVQINATESFNCSLEENHQGESKPATVCQECYDRLQQRVDLMEAALHMDIKEAAQMVYDAVWADPSDPNKTYQNAAEALLSELRKRAGISAVLGSFQTKPH
jgi:hypothetical protein